MNIIKRFRLISKVIVMLVSLGMLLMPLPQRSLIAQEKFKPIAGLRIDSVEDFFSEMSKSALLRGLSSPEMKPFADDVKKAWEIYKKNMSQKTGLDFETFSSFYSGKVICGIDVEKKVFLYLVTPKKKETASKMLTLLSEMLAKSKIKTMSQNEEGVEILVASPRGDMGKFCAGNSEMAFGICGGDNIIAARKLLSDVLKNPGQAASLFPGPSEVTKLNGPGLHFYISNLLGQMDEVSQKTIRALNLPGFQGAQLRFFRDRDYIRSVVLYNTAKDKGLSKLFKKGPISESLLKRIPAESVTAGGLHFDVSALLKTIRECAAASENPQLQMGVSMGLMTAQGFVGMDFDKELFQALGDEIAFFQLPSARGGGFPLFSMAGLGSTCLMVNVSDREKLSAGLDKLLKFAERYASKDMCGGGVVRTKIHGTDVKYLKVFSGVLSICTAIQDDVLLITNNLPLLELLLAKKYSPITGDPDFSRTLTSAGGKLRCGFSYCRYIKNASGGGMMSAYLSVSMISVLAGMLLPALTRAREAARKTQCMSNLRQIGIGATSFSDKDLTHGKYPKTVEQLITSGEILSQNVLRCPSRKGHTGHGYIFTFPAQNTNPADCIMGFDKKGNHGNYRNVLFLDCHISKMTEHAFHKLAEKMMKPPYKKYYSDADLAKFKAVIEGTESSSNGSDKSIAPVVTGLKNMDSFLEKQAFQFLSKIDFTRFPALGVFSEKSCSNLALFQKLDSGLLLDKQTGHIGSGSASGMSSIAVIAIIAAIAIPSLLRSRIAANETSAIGGLKQLVSYEASWRQTDADSNGMSDYWTLDVSGFRHVKDQGGNEVKYMDLAQARADAAPKIKSFTPSPKSGYFYQAIVKDETGKPYCQNSGCPQYKGKCTNTYKFGFCAFPAEYGTTGVNTFIVNEEGQVYRKDSGGKPVDQYPGENPTEKGWELVQ